MPFHEPVYRILDANANRAGEGLRTLEEAARFALEDTGTTSGLKQIRHDLTAALSLLDRQKLLSCRDATADVGTSVSATGENARDSVAEVVAAAAGRVEQAFRCLEEYGKTVSVKFAETIESLRYKTYSLTALMELRLISPNQRRSLLLDARLYALIDGGLNEETLLQRLGVYRESGVSMIQLRDSRLDDRTLLRRAIVACDFCRRAEMLFFVNNRLDIAMASDADGLHVGQDDVPVQVARRLLGPDRLIGVSTHDLEQIREAVDGGVDLIGCGPVFPGPTKAFASYPGITFLNHAANLLQGLAAKAGSRPLPAFAIGGIHETNVDQVAKAGFGRVAVTSALSDPQRSAGIATLMRSVLNTVALQ